MVGVDGSDQVVVVGDNVDDWVVGFGCVVAKLWQRAETTFFYVSLRSDIDISICVTFTSNDKAALVIGSHASADSAFAAIARDRTASGTRRQETSRKRWAHDG